MMPSKNYRSFGRIPIVGMGLWLLIQSTAVGAQDAVDPLKQGFEDPPAVSRPRVWWHWMNGNISKEGIRLDLEWMQRIGLGGFHVFDASLQTPKIVDQRLVYMTPEWRDAFQYATSLADQLGLEEAIAGSPGWSESGGPWVSPAEAMKKYVWSETQIAGGKPFRGRLAHPPTNIGVFQDLPVEDPGGSVGPSATSADFYVDTVVMAYKRGAEDVSLDALLPAISSSSPIDASILSDGNLTKSTLLALPPHVGEKAWIQYDFGHSQRISALSLVAGNKKLFDSSAPVERDSGIALEASEDGENYRRVIEIPRGGFKQHTISFPSVSARFFRVTFATQLPPAGLLADLGLGSAPSVPIAIPIAELRLYWAARVNRFEEKAAFTPMAGLYELATPTSNPRDVIAPTDVVNLTDRLRPDGSLDWTPPAGDWMVLRFGYSLLGVMNHPAPKESTGLEVDKLNATFVRAYMDHYLDQYRETVGPEMTGGRGIRNVVNDSWEAGAQNWTDEMITEFQNRRGYDPRHWMPALAGRVVLSAEASDRFLWDFRKTIADLIAENHYGQLEASLSERKMGHYAESHESGRALIADGMEVKKYADIPMSAMWVDTPGSTKIMYGFDADDRESASVAHIYGKTLVAAESFSVCKPSTAWAWSPATLKPTADQEFLNGINRIVIHESAHQPVLDKIPGVTLGPCGQWFNRNETWAEHARPWITYLARNSWLLQQGRAVADIAYFYGEDSNLTALFSASAPDIPAGYSFDYVNADALIHEFSVSGGLMRTKGGTRYRILVLDENALHMSLQVLRTIRGLVEAGAIVVGQKPSGTPSLGDDATEFKAIADELFGNGTGEKRVGQGEVLTGETASAALQAKGIAQDFSYVGENTDQQVRFVHRQLPEGDIYLLDNRDDRIASVNATFRVSGKAPELWFPDTGKIVAASFNTNGETTTVPLRMDPWATVFVVFREPTQVRARTLPSRSKSTTVRVLDAPWTVGFQPGRGAPATAIFDTLISLPESADRGIKYFSGEATYSQILKVPRAWGKGGAKLWIDLGDVKNLAVVSIDGKEVGTAWHAPYRLDVTSALTPGEHQLSVQVYNSWVNRLIGDRQPDAINKYTFATWRVYKADSPLLPSGLIGPVTIVRQN